MEILVHPNRPETWRNSRSPAINPRYIEELTQIGGLNYRKEPNLRFVWGQTRTQFRRGKERLLYIDERIDAIRHTRHVLKRPLLTDESGRVTTWDTQVLDHAPDIVPEGWLYEEELKSIEWIGEQWFYMEQWYAPEIALPNGEVFLPFGTPEQWERDRYEDWEDPELGMVRHCDVLGPFPREGRYTAIWRVVQPFSYFEETEYPMTVPVYTEDGALTPPYPGAQPIGFVATEEMVKHRELVDSVCYREPDERDLLFARAGRFERDRRHIVSQEQRGIDKFYEDSEKRRKAKEERVGAKRHAMRGEEWRFSSPDAGTTGGVGGGARSYLTNVDAAPQLKKGKVA
jgi:hypothetical protein